MAGIYPRKAYRGSPEPLTIKLTPVKAGLTQVQASAKAGVSKESWPRYEQGKRKMPFAVWQRFLEATGLKPVK